MRVLVLGGTQFLGKHVTQTLLDRGHDVTIMHRGEHGRELFPHVRRIIGDREHDLDRLPDEHWDAVIDTSGYLPHIVASSAQALCDRAHFSVFVSSISVYDIASDALDEDSALLALPADVDPRVFAGTQYGPLKVLCEAAAVSAFGPSRTLIVRPGLIVGPDDPTDRFTAWVMRFSRGARIAVPDDPDAPVQWIDVRDLAAFIVDAGEQRRSGVLNAVGPAEPMQLRKFFAACMSVALNGTVNDTHAWAVSARGDALLQAGLSDERERALLENA